ncbi:MAG: type II secretion system protein [Patescibacteria group bacterium]
MRRRAFTLIELLVYVGVLVIVLGAIFFFMVNIITNERSIGDRVRMMDEADFAMRQVLDHARGAKNLESTDFAFSNDGELTLTKTDAVVTIKVDKSDPTKPKLIMTKNDGINPVSTRILTSPRVAVDIFTLECAGTISPCSSNAKGVRIKLGLRDLVTYQTITITTGATPRGY